jgi:hypothetical protein
MREFFMLYWSGNWAFHGITLIPRKQVFCRQAGTNTELEPLLHNDGREIETKRAGDVGLFAEYLERNGYKEVSKEEWDKLVNKS